MNRVILIILALCAIVPAGQRPPVRCTENSPERRGEEGCTVLANRPLLGSLPKTVYWHIDRFDSLKAAKKAASPNAVAAEAHGFFWLLTVEAKTKDHHGGHHVTWIGPLVLPATDSSMRVQSSLLMPGARTPPHTHPGPEVIYVVDGEQCMEMPKVGKHLGPGQSYVVPGGTTHRGRPIGSKARRALALNLYDAAHSVSHDLADTTPLVSCK
jgi:quercetin dioxygenase-like cupin family protein